MPIIRSKSNNLVIVGTESWSSRPDLVVGNELTYDNVLYSAHFYAADHKEQNLQYVKDAIENEIPLFITEFGTQSASGDGDNDFTSSDMWLDYLDSNKISWISWNISNDFRSGAVYKKWYELNTVADYSDTINMKEAGIWIYNRLKYGDVAISFNKNNSKFSSLFKNKFLKNNHLYLNEIKKGVEITIYNISGKKVLQTEKKSESLCLNRLSKGVYFIEIKNSNLSLQQKIRIY